MSIVMHCTGCQQEMTVPSEAAGKRIRCRHCDAVMNVPAKQGNPTRRNDDEEHEPPTKKGLPPALLVALVGVAFLFVGSVGTLIVIAVGGRSAKTDAPPTSNDDIKAPLIGTRWDWGDGIVEFRADGTVEHPGWTYRKLVTNWEVIDRRTVMMTIVGGRNIDRICLLKFTDDLQGFDGYNFIGASRRFNIVSRVGQSTPSRRDPATADETALQTNLTNSDWTWGQETLKLRPDGYIEHTLFTVGNSTVIRWEVFDRRTVILYVERGRTQDRYAVLRFDETGTKFNATSFQNLEQVEGTRK